MKKKSSKLTGKRLRQAQVYAYLLENLVKSFRALIRFYISLKDDKKKALKKVYSLLKQEEKNV